MAMVYDVIVVGAGNAALVSVRGVRYNTGDGIRRAK